jgi:GTP:adenosylcobinamide-phosphate guanylyltransferase
MDAIVTAGGIPLPEEPLYDATRGHPKALVDIAGKPMVQWVLDALTEAKCVDNVVVVGLTEKSGLTCGKPMFFVSNQGKMVENMQAGAQKVREINSKAEYALIVSSDIPAITGEMADWVVETAMQTKLDIYYNVIPRAAMEKRFPGSKRTWTHLKEIEVCGGDMNIARIKTLTGEDTDMWKKITDSRKSPLKQAALIGFDTAFLLLTKRLTLERAEKTITTRLNVTGKVLVCPFAEVGMDVDKPHQLEMMRLDLKKRLKKAARIGSASPQKVRKVAKTGPASPKIEE